MHTLIAPTINLFILIALLVYYTKAPLKDFVSNRHHTLSNDLQSVRSQLAAAKAKFSEFSARLASLHDEVTKLKEQARKDAEEMKSRIMQDAQRLAATIKTDSQSSAESLFSELKGQLRQELSGKVLERAEAILKSRLTGDDRVRIRQEFSRQLESTQ